MMDGIRIAWVVTIVVVLFGFGGITADEIGFEQVLMVNFLLLLGLSVVTWIAIHPRRWRWPPMTLEGMPRLILSSMGFLVGVQYAFSSGGGRDVMLACPPAGLVLGWLAGAALSHVLGLYAGHGASMPGSDDMSAHPRVRACPYCGNTRRIDTSRHCGSCGIEWTTPRLVGRSSSDEEAAGIESNARDCHDRAQDSRAVRRGRCA